jgi:hypothetical protein
MLVLYCCEDKYSLMDLDTVNTLLFFATVLLVSFIAWIILSQKQDEPNEINNLFTQEQQDNETTRLTESERKQSKAGTDRDVQESEITGRYELDISGNVTSSSQKKQNEMEGVIPNNQPIDSCDNTINTGESNPLLLSMSSQEELEIEINEATQESNDDDGLTQDQSEGWIVL